MQFSGNNANNYEKYIHKVVSCYNFLQIPRIFYGFFFFVFCIEISSKNWFPGFAHILHMEFLTVKVNCELAAALYTQNLYAAAQATRKGGWGRLTNRILGTAEGAMSKLSRLRPRCGAWGRQNTR